MVTKRTVHRKPYKYKEPKPQIQYSSIQDIIESMRIACACGIREKAFDWKEVAVKGFLNRHRIMNICKPYGKIRIVPHGFVIKFER